MDPLTGLVLAVLISNALTGGRVGSALAAGVSAAGGAGRSAWAGPAPSTGRGGSTRKGSTTPAGRVSTVEPVTGHVRRGAVEGWDRGWQASRDRHRSRMERVRGGYRSGRERFRNWLMGPGHDLPDPTDDEGPPCGCCGTGPGREPHPDCPWCKGHDHGVPDGSKPDGPKPVPEPRTETPPQTPPAVPASGPATPNPGGTRMADVSAPQIVAFWKKVASDVAAQVEGERSSDLHVEGGSDLASALSAHADKVDRELSAFIEHARAATHKYAAAYQE